MTSYTLVESLPFPKDIKLFQDSIHPMAVQQVPIDRSYGYESLTHGNQNTNDSGYFSFQSGYGDNKQKIGYDKACAAGHLHRDVLGVVTFRDKYGDLPDPDCGCTKYRARTCTGQFNPKACGGIKGGSCTGNTPVCCYPGDMCAEDRIGDLGTCIAGQKPRRRR